VSQNYNAHVTERVWKVSELRKHLLNSLHDLLNSLHAGNSTIQSTFVVEPVHALYFGRQPCDSMKAFSNVLICVFELYLQGKRQLIHLILNDQTERQRFNDKHGRVCLVVSGHYRVW